MWTQIIVDLPKELGDGLEHAYEFRPPNKDEWFLSVIRHGANNQVQFRVIQADKDMQLSFFILKRTKPCLTIVE